jgi:hypothetical protein
MTERTQSEIRLVAKIASALAEYWGDGGVSIAHTAEAARMMGWNPRDFIVVKPLEASLHPPLHIVTIDTDDTDIPF